MDKKEVVAIRKNIEPGERMKILERIKDNGTIEEIRIKFYPGEELTLHVRPTVAKTLGRVVDLLTYPKETNNFISGDDDYFIYPVILPVEMDDELQVIAENTGTVESTLSIDIVVDYYGGTSRISGGVVNG